MPGLEPGIHVLRATFKKDVDGRVKPGHDETEKPYALVASFRFLTDAFAGCGGTLRIGTT
jgi:hypothetical protein